MSNNKKRLVINIEGIVQGVGFRPFIYGLAVKYRINGWIANYPDGVVIEAEGDNNNLQLFFDGIFSELPAISYISGHSVKEESPIGYESFEIKESKSLSTHNSLISPDLSVCDECLAEMMDPSNRRYMYPFINCTNCGPRFTIIGGIPYDRINTTMKSFEMCEACESEYKDPIDRRFHAQPVACSKCGPKLRLLDNLGNSISAGREIEATISFLKQGKILAIKGLGGYHLACDAKNKEAVKLLRTRKERDGKPFALMAKNIDATRKYCHINSEEEKLLESVKRPIVLLEKLNNEELPYEYISASNNLLGVMLPYTPVHYLLFKDNLEILVMTSGNRSGEPVCYNDNDVVKSLTGIADFYLTNNREIYIRTDDTVTSVFKGKEYISRRSRGYVPFPIDLSFMTGHKNENIPSVLSCGSELKNTFCITKGSKAFLSHHIGDLENLETLNAFEDGIEHFKRLLTVTPEIISFDKHPEYLSTKYAEEKNYLKKVEVQHHKAHIASCMAENGVNEPIIGVAFDGTGYGDDGNIWGGEFFCGDYNELIRCAHFSYMPMPGGEKAIKEPWRMAFGMLYEAFGDDVFDLDLEYVKRLDKLKVNILKHLIVKNVNTPKTSSAGRIFDAVSSVLGFCDVITYEGEAAILLENKSIKSDKCYNYDVLENNGTAIIDTRALIKDIVNDIILGSDLSYIASAFHNTMATIILEMCKKIRCVRKIKDAGRNDSLNCSPCIPVALSGGVFQNRLLLGLTIEKLERDDFRVYIHSKVPSNDGGISLGQATIALAKCLKDYN